MSEDMYHAAAHTPDEIAHELVGRSWEIIPGRLSFSIHRDEEHTKQLIHQNPRIFYFSSWMQESYEGFCSDFGPVNLAAVVRFCRFMRERLYDPRLAKRELVYYCDPDTAYLTNTAFLLGAYLVLVEKWSPESAAKIFENIEPCPFRQFRDATHVPSTFDLCLLDCFRGLARAVESRFFSYESFDVEDYEMLDDAEHADVHIMCPKFIAFRGPLAKAKANRWALKPEQFVPLFKELNVSGVVRLNDADTYDKAAFTSRNIAHHDLYFDDCTAPSSQIVRDFHEVADNEPGMVAVHCAAGLGRTGTLIATWIMANYRWSARETIAWLRIVRPGSVIGPQQHFLEFYERQIGISGSRREARSAMSPSDVEESSRLMLCSAEHSKLLASQITYAPRRHSMSIH